MPTRTPDEGRRSIPPRRTEALAWAVGLTALFAAVYGGCNWITSRRSDVGVLRFGWEEHIPLLPWLIVPYMSIDLFFVAAPFLCRTREELRNLGQRLATATLLAGVGFLLLPLTLDGERPAFEGWAGALHDFLKANDRPHNLFPSLHVAYTLLLWPLYRRRTRGLLRAGVDAWLGLVLLSVLTVYQHHFMDAVGGAALALLCRHLLPGREPGDAPAFNPRPDLAARYVAAAAIAWAATPWLGLGGILSAWAGLSLASVGVAYRATGAALFAKRRGRVHPIARALLWPYLLGLWVTRVHYRRREAAPHGRACDAVIFGRRLRPRERTSLREAGVSAVLDLTAEHSAGPSDLPYLNIPILDLTVPTEAQCRAAVAFIDRHSPRGPVYVHCGLGYSRSACIAAAYLLASARCASVEEACRVVRAARPGVTFGDGALALLGRVGTSGRLTACAPARP